MSKQAQNTVSANATAEKATGTRTVHTLKYAGADGKATVVNFTRWSKAVREMRAHLDAGLSVEVSRREAKVTQSIVVDDGE